MTYRAKYDDHIPDDLDFIQDLMQGDFNKEWPIFLSQLRKEIKRLAKDPYDPSRPCDYPPLSTYGYRKRYFHSIPLKEKIQSEFKDLSSDYRLIFKVNEEKKTIFYHAIGPRIKERRPGNPNDIWQRIKTRRLPEEE